MIRGSIAPLLLLLLLTAAGLAQAAPPQTVYRCGPDGRSYSQTPCADGKALSADDPRTPNQQKAARDVAEPDAEQARKLAEERHQREAAAKGQQAAGFRTPAPPEAASTPIRKPKPKSKAASAAAESTMSPVMRTPAQGTSSR